MDRRTFLTASGAGLAAVGVPTAARATDRPSPRSRATRTGAQRLADDGWKALAGPKLGLVTNPTGILNNYTHIVDDMWASGNVDLAAVFGPEHGFRGSAQAGEAEDTTIDPRTGITVYNAHRAQQEDFEQMYSDAGVEVVLFDIQDVGARFYTYIWTMWMAMRAAAALGLPFVVLDRPNPIGGSAAGPMLFPGYESGVGRRYIVQQHGMTVGELARLFNEEFLPDDAGAQIDDLQVVELENWDPSSMMADTGAPWVLPSPNMPTPDTALVYPGTCLFEGTAAAEGRGTTRPFELVGAPYVDYHWSDDLNEAALPGVEFREAYFVPTFGKFTGETCGGVQVHVTDPQRFDPIRTGVAMIVALKARYPGDFQWRGGGDSDGFIDLLHGSDRLRTMVDAGATADDIVASWQEELRDFGKLRRPYLLYRGRR